MLMRSTRQMAKVMTTPFLVLLQVLFYAARFTRKVLASLVVVCVGVALATATEMQLTMIGSLIAVAACFVTSVYNIVREERESARYSHVVGLDSGWKRIRSGLDWMPCSCCHIKPRWRQSCSPAAFPSLTTCRFYVTIT